VTRDRNTPDPARRSERSRQAILSAAADLLAEHGWGKLTVEAIASKAGVGKQTIYRWWPDKGAVVLDAYLALVDAGGALTFPDTGDLAADLRQVMRVTAGSLADPEFAARYRALLAAIQDDAALATALHDRLLRPWLDATAARLAAAGTRGDPHVAAELLYGPVYYRWLLRTGPVTTEYVDAVVAAVLRAVS
jgi:AcrR family transcriptional regulator